MDLIDISNRITPPNLSPKPLIYSDYLELVKQYRAMVMSLSNDEFLALLDAIQEIKMEGDRWLNQEYGTK